MAVDGLTDEFVRAVGHLAVVGGVGHGLAPALLVGREPDGFAVEAVERALAGRSLAQVGVVDAVGIERRAVGEVDAELLGERVGRCDVVVDGIAPEDIVGHKVVVGFGGIGCLVEADVRIEREDGRIEASLVVDEIAVEHLHAAVVATVEGCARAAVDEAAVGLRFECGANGAGDGLVQVGRGVFGLVVGEDGVIDLKLVVEADCTAVARIVNRSRLGHAVVACRGRRHCPCDQFALADGLVFGEEAVVDVGREVDVDACAIASLIVDELRIADVERNVAVGHSRVQTLMIQVVVGAVLVVGAIPVAVATQTGAAIVVVDSVVVQRAVNVVAGIAVGDVDAVDDNRLADEARAESVGHVVAVDADWLWQLADARCIRNDRHYVIYAGVLQVDGVARQVGLVLELPRFEDVVQVLVFKHAAVGHRVERQLNEGDGVAELGIGRKMVERVGAEADGVGRQHSAIGRRIGWIRFPILAVKLVAVEAAHQRHALGDEEGVGQ